MKSGERKARRGRAKTAADHRQASGRKAQRLALRQDGQWHSVLFYRSSTAIALTSTSVGEFLFVNDAFVDLFGFSREELIGKTTLELGIADEEARGAIVATLQSSGAVRNHECVRYAKGRRPLTVLMNLEQVTMCGRRCILTTVQDITAQREAERAKSASDAAVQQAVLDSLSEGVGVVDASGKVLFVNEEGRKLLGVTPSELSTSLTAVIARIRRADGSAIPVEEYPTRMAIRSGGAVRDLEFRYPGADGAQRWLNVNARPVRDAEGRVTGAAMSFVDITARKEQEQALRDADRQKTEFLGILSHELRNPLAAIEAGLYLLNKDPAIKALGERGQRSLDIIRRQLGRVVHQVDELLDVTRIANGKVHLQRERVNLVELVQSCVEDARVAKGRVFETSLSAAPCWVRGDPMRLTEVLANLLENAAKFTPRDGKIRVSVARNGGDCVVEVSDTGIGLEAKMLGRLFRPFAQADHQTEQNPRGLGLGLALVKGLVELHGGAVSARSEGPGKGASFQVTLPSERDEEAVEADRPKRHGEPEAPALAATAPVEDPGPLVSAVHWPRREAQG